MQITQENARLEIGIEAVDSRVRVHIIVSMLLVLILFLIAVLRTNIWVALIFFALIILIGLAEACYDRAYPLRLVLDATTRLITIDNPRYRWPGFYVKVEERFDTIISLDIVASKKPDRFHVRAKLQSEGATGVRDRVLTRLRPFSYPLKLELAQRMLRCIAEFCSAHGAKSLEVEEVEL